MKAGVNESHKLQEQRNREDTVRCLTTMWSEISAV